MLTLTFLGVGGAFAKRNFQSNVLVEAWSVSPEAQDVPDDTLLIDFGATGPLALHALKQRDGFDYLDAGGRTNYAAIHRILVTHLHGDHIGGLEELAFSNMFARARNETSPAKPHKPQLVSNMSILVNLWDHSLKGGLSALEGRYALLQDYFFIHALRDSPGEGGCFQMLKRYEFEMFPTDHLRIQRKYDWPSYGVHITDRQTGETAFYSGDTRFDYPAYARMMHNAKVCFHDAQLFDHANPVHALLSELRTMPEDVKKKTHLYHYSDDWDSGPFASVGEEFAGFAKPQRRYVLFA